MALIEEVWGDLEMTPPSPPPKPTPKPEIDAALVTPQGHSESSNLSRAAPVTEFFSD